MVQICYPFIIDDISDKLLGILCNIGMSKLVTYCLSKPTRDIKCLFVDVQNLAFFSSKKSYFPVFEVGGDKDTVI